MPKIIENRDARILEAAVKLAKQDSYQWIRREDVAREAGVSGGSINRVFGTMADLKRAVIRHAIEVGELSIVAEALGARHPIALDECPADLRKEAMQFALRG